MSDTTPSATVDIVDVFADARKIPATELKAGHYVFDAVGGRHKVKRVRVLTRHVKFERDDYPWPEYLAKDETITITDNSTPQEGPQ